MYVIQPDKYIACSACEALCPAGAVQENGGAYAIDPDTCIGCGTCAAGCPMAAIEEK